MESKGLLMQEMTVQYQLLNKITNLGGGIFQSTLDLFCYTTDYEISETETSNFTDNLMSSRVFI